MAGDEEWLLRQAMRIEYHVHVNGPTVGRVVLEISRLGGRMWECMCH